MVAYELVDIGANLCHPSFDSDRNEVLERARRAGVTEESTDAAFKFASKHPNFLYYTAGVHPHDAKDFSDEITVPFLRQHLVQNSNCVAVGECGLDYNRVYSSRTEQLKAFKPQVDLACELKKPLFIHEREAHDDMVEILSAVGDRLPLTVIHCFTGTVDEARKYIEMGLYIGLTGFLWKDRTENGVKSALKNGDIPLERLVLETDSPFMFPKIDDKKIPVEIRAKFSEEALLLHKFGSFNRNEPCTLAAICELISAFMGRPVEEVAHITTENAKKIYGLS